MTTMSGAGGKIVRKKTQRVISIFGSSAISIQLKGVSSVQQNFDLFTQRRRIVSALDAFPSLALSESVHRYVI